jgi:hypothetical protein
LIVRVAAPLACFAASAACTASPSEVSSSTSSRISGAIDAGAPSTLTFSSDWTETAAGPLVAGAPITIDYDADRLPTCRASSEIGTPGWSITAFYAVNGVELGSVTVAGVGLANASPPATFTVPFAGTLAIWFQGTDDTGCSAYDSNYGQNYGFVVGAPSTAPAWVGNALTLIDRGTCGQPPGPCFADAEPADETFAYDTWARTEAVIARAFFDVWQPGETDSPNPSLWQELDVQMYSRLGGAGGFTASYVDYFAPDGNNARYSVDLRALDPLDGQNEGALTDKSECPAVPTTISADGQYLLADFQYVFVVNGVEVGPSAGGVYHGTYSNYLGLYAICGYSTGI